MSRVGRKQRVRIRRRAKIQRKAERRRLKVSPAVTTPPPVEAADPVVGVDPVVIDPGLRWYIAKTLPRMGDRALRALHDAQVDTFQPRSSEVVVRRGRRVVRHTQLLMRGVFIGVRDAVHLAEAQGVPGLAEIVSYPEEEDEGTPEGNVSGMVMRPARLDPAALQRFADAVAQKEIVAPMGVPAGSSVLVMAGAFASFPGVVEEVLPGHRLKVAVSIFGRCTPVELGLADVRLA